MALTVQTQAPDFTLPSTDGSDFQLSKDLAGKPCILYFYPKDFTPGCTAESCEFRDQFATFREVDITVLGISQDTVETHLKFKKAHQLPFELLADTRAIVSKAYKATIPILGFTKRITYLLDKNHTIVAVYENLFGYKNHINEMIKKVKEIDKES